MLFVLGIAVTQLMIEPLLAMAWFASAFLTAVPSFITVILGKDLTLTLSLTLTLTLTLIDILLGEAMDSEPLYSTLKQIETVLGCLGAAAFAGEP